jgi:hypothetical protein
MANRDLSSQQEVTGERIRKRGKPASGSAPRLAPRALLAGRTSAPASDGAHMVVSGPVQEDSDMWAWESFYAHLCSPQFFPSHGSGKNVLCM